MIIYAFEFLTNKYTHLNTFKAMDWMNLSNLLQGQIWYEAIL